MRELASNQDAAYKAAVLTYEVLREHGDRMPEPSAIRKKLDRLIQGLTAEDEFAALCLWSGRCSLIHKLDKSVRPRDSNYEVPDFLFIVQYQGRDLPLLVEVKSSVQQKYRLTKTYCERLKRYADAVGLPLLIAFKFTKHPNPFWSLFEFVQIRTPRGSYRVSMPDILRHNLTGVLLGDFVVQLWQGTTISMTVTKKAVRSETEILGTLTDVHWETKDKKRSEWVPLLDKLFALTEDDVDIEEHPDKLIQRFTKLGEDGAMAYWALPYALPVDRYQVTGHTDWGRLIDEQSFSFTLEDIRRAAVSAIRLGLVRYVLDQLPNEWPSFLPERQPRNQDPTE